MLRGVRRKALLYLINKELEDLAHDTGGTYLRELLKIVVMTLRRGATRTRRGGGGAP